VTSWTHINNVTKWILLREVNVCKQGKSAYSSQFRKSLKGHSRTSKTIYIGRTKLIVEREVKIWLYALASVYVGERYFNKRRDKLAGQSHTPKIFRWENSFSSGRRKHKRVRKIIFYFLSPSLCSESKIWSSLLFCDHILLP